MLDKENKTLQIDGDGVIGGLRKSWRGVERRYERGDFVRKMLETGQGGGKCCGKAIGEVDPSTLGKTILLK